MLIFWRLCLKGGDFFSGFKIKIFCRECGDLADFDYGFFERLIGKGGASLDIFFRITRSSKPQGD